MPPNGRFGARILLVAAAFLASFLPRRQSRSLSPSASSHKSIFVAARRADPARHRAAARAGCRPLAFGPLVGQALGSFVLTLLWVAGGRGAWLLIAAPLIVAAARVAGAPAARAAGASRHRTGDAVALPLLLLLVPLVVGLPFAHVGEITAGRPGLSRLLHGRLRVAPGRGDRARQGRRRCRSIRISPATRCITTGCRTCCRRAVSICRRVGDARRAAADSLDLDRCCSSSRSSTAWCALFRVRPWAAAAGVAFVVLAIEFRRAVCAVRFLAQERAARRGEEPQHRRHQPLVFPGHPDRRPAAAAVLPAASHRRLRDRPDRPARDRDADARRSTPRRSRSAACAWGCRSRSAHLRA